MIAPTEWIFTFFDVGAVNDRPKNVRDDVGIVPYIVESEQNRTHLKPPLCKGRWIFAEQKDGGIDRKYTFDDLRQSLSQPSADSSLYTREPLRRTRERAIGDRPYMGIRFNQPRRDTRPRVSVRIDMHL